MKLFPTKLLQLFIILLLCNLPYIASLGNRHKSSAQNHLENTNNAYISSLKALKKRAIIPVQKETNSDFSIGLGPIYYTNWVKYIHFPRSAKEVPREFFVNTQYSEQFKGNSKLDLKETSKDEIGNNLFKNIPSQFEFYLILFKDNIAFLKSRHSESTQTFDTLQIEKIENCPEEMMKNRDENNKKHGIQDYGNFKEGNCVKILTDIENWILCTKTQQDKELLFTTLLKLKINNQRENYKFISSSDTSNTKDSTLGNFLNKNPSQSTKPNVGVPINGYWITLQNWSQCSLKCGGGVSTLHRMCVEPKNGGLPCQGQAILTKPCNVDPCPSTSAGVEPTQSLKPIVKVMPFSQRPQRYEKCVLKESDMLFTNNSTTLSNKNAIEEQKQIPVRLIMNQNTISIFNGEELSTRLLTFNIESTTFRRVIPKDIESQRKEDCFVLSSGNQIAELCPLMTINCQKQIEEWDYDFHLFKNQCRPKRYAAKFDIEGELKKKIEEAKQAVLEERESVIRNEEIKREAEKERLKIRKAERLALEAIEKQIRIETLLKQEAEEMELREEEELKEQIKEQERKEQCLLKAIKQKQIENQLNQEKIHTSMEVDSIAQKTKEELMKRREALKEDLKKRKMQRRAKLEELRTKYQAQKIRVGEVVKNAYKKGNTKNCEKGIKDTLDRTAYCKASFPEEPNKFTLCMSSADEFCQLCCDNEFGDFYYQERNNCILKVCKTNPPVMM